MRPAMEMCSLASSTPLLMESPSYSRRFEPESPLHRCIRS
jgi:hypothetical protein